MIQNIKNILLVDDDLDDQLLFVQALSETDKSIAYSFACDGFDALQKLGSPSTILPDVLFLDVNMPKMNGLDCLLEIKKTEKLKQIPVVMYSTASSMIYQKICFANGAVAFIQKPADFAELTCKLKLILSDEMDLTHRISPVVL